MTLLVNPAKAPTPEAPETEATPHNGHRESAAVIDHKVAASEAAQVTAPPEEALRTLQARLQTQLTSAQDANAGDPEARFLAQTISRRLNQVNAALERIAEGKYGVCTDCHEPIENDRLVLQPMSTRCTSCQAIAEWRGVTY